jgi:hypothetical protein
MEIELKRQNKVSRLHQNPAWKDPAYRDSIVVHMCSVLVINFDRTTTQIVGIMGSLLENPC